MTGCFRTSLTIAIGLSLMLGFCISADATVFDWTFRGVAICGGRGGCTPNEYFFVGAGTFTTGAPVGAGFDIVDITGIWDGRRECPGRC